VCNDDQLFHALGFLQNFYQINNFLGSHGVTRNQRLAQRLDGYWSQFVHLDGVPLLVVVHYLVVDWFRGNFERHRFLPRDVDGDISRT